MLAKMEAVAVDQAPTPKRYMSTCVEGGSETCLHMDDYFMNEPAWKNVSHQNKDRKRAAFAGLMTSFPGLVKILFRRRGLV